MSRKNAPRTRLGVEMLEDRTVPATFAPNQGESLAVGDVIPGNSLTPGGTDYEYVTGTGPGTLGVVKIFDSNGVLKQQVTPFAGWTGGIHVAVGEVNGLAGSPKAITVGGISMAGDGTVTVNVGAGLPHGFTVGQTVRISGANVFDAMTGTITYSYDGEFTITNVIDAFSFEYITFPPQMLPGAADGGTAATLQKDIIVSTAAGGTGRVRVYSFTGNQFRSQALLTPFGPNYVGGIQVTTGNVTGDYTREILVGQETNGSVVKAFSVDPNSAGKSFFEVRKFKAFEATYKGGVSLASTNIDAAFFDPTGDTEPDYNEIIVGKARSAPLLRIYDAQFPAVSLRAEYFVFDTGSSIATTGINVAAGSTDGLRGGEIYVSLRNSTNVQIISGETGVPIGEFNVPYPASYGRNVEIAINELADDITPASRNTSYDDLVTDMFIVAGDGPYFQVPIVFPGVYFSPAGLNGSNPAP
ncbi:hypothetical protein [Gemmata sp.]|uniref:hypothetical protein n=1 Tax=Gemmata sp. TaxID=1914242 RepID=UPI003F711963